MQYPPSDTLPEKLAFLRPVATKICLFELEDVLVEVGLQVFVGVVDAQLLEGVPFGSDVLEAENIEDSNVVARFARAGLATD